MKLLVNNKFIINKNNIYFGLIILLILKIKYLLI